MCQKKKKRGKNGALAGKVPLSGEPCISNEGIPDGASQSSGISEFPIRVSVWLLCPPSNNIGFSDEELRHTERRSFATFLEGSQILQECPHFTPLHDAPYLWRSTDTAFLSGAHRSIVRPRLQSCRQPLSPMLDLMSVCTDALSDRAERRESVWILLFMYMKSAICEDLLGCRGHGTSKPARKRHSGFPGCSVSHLHLHPKLPLLLLRSGDPSGGEWILPPDHGDFRLYDVRSNLRKPAWIDAEMPNVCTGVRTFQKDYLPRPSQLYIHKALLISPGFAFLFPFSVFKAISFL